MHLITSQYDNTLNVELDINIGSYYLTGISLSKLSLRGEGNIGYFTVQIIGNYIVHVHVLESCNSSGVARIFI